MADVGTRWVGGLADVVGGAAGCGTGDHDRADGRYPRRPPARPSAMRSWLVLVVLVIVVQGAGSLGALTTDASYYQALARPSWAPPGWLFGPVWVTLYAMIAVSIWLVWRRPPAPARTAALRWHAAQLALNAAWTPVFFGLRAPGAALVVIVALLAAIAGTIATTRRATRPAAWLLVPYALWVGFAAVLNAALWLGNR